ncbi:glycosyltransferase [Salininema proteolyticum]|uniref:Glycosyltransferase n=1 Tax=Salininema proteolyticum TaxID=1607685 RepID=A0ABV8U163_9ACTN
MPRDFDSDLVAETIRRSGPPSAQTIYEWSQYHRVRITRRLLAVMADPDRPDRFEPGGDLRPDLPVERSALAALAAAEAGQARTEEDFAHAAQLFGLVHRRSKGNLPDRFHDLYALSLFRSGAHAEALDLARRLPGASATIRNAIHTQTAHPQFGGDKERYLKRFSAFAGHPGALDTDGDLDIDRLSAAGRPGSKRGPLITVVMSAFRPDETLLSAVGSVCRQTWADWELLVVDDGSGEEYDGIYARVEALDDRITVLRQPENAGTYQARNRALAVAKGEFTTGLDSDDWAFPDRLERQVAPFLARPGLVMVESRSVAVAPDLSLILDPQTAVLATRSTPIMVRTAPARDQIGFYDEVRRTADSEYRKRIRNHFGDAAWTRCGGTPLSLVRHTPTTLSAGEVGSKWMSTSRLAYHSGVARWHKRIAEGGASAYLPANPTVRPFPITGDITRTRQENERRYDRVYIADWTELDDTRRALLEEIDVRAARGDAVALAHMPDFRAVGADQPLLHASAVSFAVDRGLDFVDLKDGLADDYVAEDGYLRRLTLAENPWMEAGAIEAFAAGEDDAEGPVPVALGPAPRRRLPRPVKLAAAVVAGLSLVAVLSLMAEIPWLAGGGAALAVLTACLGLAALRSEAAERHLAPYRVEEPVKKGLPAARVREIDAHAAYLRGGWPEDARLQLTRIAFDLREPAGVRDHAAAALNRWYEDGLEDPAPGRERRFDIVVAAPLDLLGGTTTANEADLLAYREAGLSVGVFHHPIRGRAPGRRVNPKITRLVDGERIQFVDPADDVSCSLFVAHFPLAFQEPVERRPSVRADRSVLILHQTPFEEYGPSGGYGTSWDIGKVHRNLTDWVGPHSWHAVGPAVVDAMHRHHAAELEGVDLSEECWYNIIDVAEWDRGERTPPPAERAIRVGRHSRDHITKWPNMAKRLREAYPAGDGVEVHVLGGDSAVRKIVGRPGDGWTCHPFGAVSAQDFLETVDAYVYFVDDHYVEAFGRAPLEAMAMGLPCVLPPRFRPLFGDAAIYCETSEVRDVLRRLHEDPPLYREHAKAGRELVRERFSNAALRERLRGLGVAVPDANPEPVETEVLR